MASSDSSGKGGSVMTFDEAEWGELENYRDYLEHYGVPGMRWGVRKDRETSGRKRSASDKKKAPSFRERLEKRRRQKRLKAARKARSDAKNKAAKEAKRRQNILRSPSKLYKNRYDFTQDEISDALKRFKWEEELRNYSKKQMDAGKEYVDSIFKFTTSAINIYNNAARVVNSFDLSEKPWEYIEPAKNDKKKDN